MSASWISLIVVCAAFLRVANNLPVEGDIDRNLSLDSSLDEEVGSARSSTSDGSNSNEPGGVDLLSRDKRTIGVLRQVFPGLSQIVDRKIQMLTRLIFRFIGRLVLRGGAGGGAGGGTTGSSGDSGRKISITLPTYPPSPDDDEEEEDETEAPEDGASTTAAASAALDEMPGDSPDATDDSTTTTTEASDAENSVSESKVSEVKVRVTREAEKTSTNDDQAADATGDNNETDNDLDSTSDNDNESEGSDENPRNKRLLNFNLGGGGGGSGGGSGNFLFDIIRRTADGAARMAGTVYRVLAGTDDVGLPVYPPLPSAKQPRLLVAGSGTTQEKDEAENAPVDDSAGVGDSGTDLSNGKSDDGYSAGVPGPLTRLFVIANRGISNLMQDLILRLAQTSERIVNFKARLITSII